MGLGPREKKLLAYALGLSRGPHYDPRIGLPFKDLTRSFFPKAGEAESAVERLRGKGLLEYVTPEAQHARLTPRGRIVAGVVLAGSTIRELRDRLLAEVAQYAQDRLAARERRIVTTRTQSSADASWGSMRLVVLGWTLAVMGVAFTVFPFLGLLSLFFLFPAATAAWLYGFERLQRAPGSTRNLAALLAFGALLLMAIPAVVTAPHVNMMLLSEQRLRVYPTLGLEARNANLERSQRGRAGVRRGLTNSVLSGVAAAALQLLAVRWRTGRRAAFPGVFILLGCGFGPAVVGLIFVLSDVWPLTA